MDPDQPAHPRSLIRIHAVRLPTLLQVEKTRKMRHSYEHNLYLTSITQTVGDTAELSFGELIHI
jgi:hypothetical protein